MQLVASVVLIMIGLWLAFLVSNPGDLRIFGWVVAGVGVLGLIIRAVLAHQRDRLQ
jgi:hypothetical protein